MRITVEEKNATRRRIIDAAVDLFQSHGFDATTTRDIAKGAGIATGTLFNYFETKEAIVTLLATEALGKARQSAVKATGDGGLEEDLFALVASELRQLKPLRKFITPLLETVLSPLAISKLGDAGQALRVEHLEAVGALVRQHGLGEVSPLAWQVYWSLYTGALAFWAADKSPKQEDSLALLDQSLNMFVAWLRDAAGEPRI